MKGSVQPRPDRGPDAYLVRWYVGRDERGKRIERTRLIRAKNQREADALAVPIFAEFQAADEHEAKQRGTVAWYADRWLAAKRRQLSPTTIERSYAPIVERIKAEFGRMQLEDVRPRHVKDWYAKLAETKTGTGKRRKTLSAKAIERHHQVLRAMFREALEDELVDRVPTTVRRPKPRKAQLTIPTEDLVARLLDGVTGNFGNMVRLEAETGLRNGELCGLLWSDITPYEHAELVDGEPVKVTGLMISVRRAVIEVSRDADRPKDVEWRQTARGSWWGVKPTKTDNERDVLVTEDGMVALVDQLRSVTEQMGGDELRARGGFVFPDVAADRRGRVPRMPSWITRQWSKVRGEYGLQGVRFYDLRHFHGSHMNAAGVDPKTIQERLGHSTILTTMNTYVHSTEQQSIGAAKAARVER